MNLLSGVRIVYISIFFKLCCDSIIVSEENKKTNESKSNEDERKYYNGYNQKENKRGKPPTWIQRISKVISVRNVGKMTGNIDRLGE